MTDPRIEGAATQAEGQIQNGLGRMTGDSRLQFDGKVKEMKGKALDAYGRVIDGLDGLVEKAPEQYRGRARQGLDFARRKPLLTTGVVAGLALLLSGAGRRRRKPVPPRKGKGPDVSAGAPSPAQPAASSAVSFFGAPDGPWMSKAILPSLSSTLTCPPRVRRPNRMSSASGFLIVS